MQWGDVVRGTPRRVRVLLKKLLPEGRRGPQLTAHAASSLHLPLQQPDYTIFCQGQLKLERVSLVALSNGPSLLVRTVEWMTSLLGLGCSPTPAPAFLSTLVQLCETPQNPYEDIFGCAVAKNNMAPLTSVAGQTVATKSQAKSMPIPPFLYAEFLPKLGRISIVIHLPTPSTYLTKALVSDDARRLLVYHEGATTELVLPVKTALKNEHLPGEIPPGLDEMSWRLVPHKSEVAAAGFGRSGFDAGAVPWSAVDLKPHVDVTCRTCGTVFISKDNLKEWKDLPSENWAEMMEFWHCHKPTNNTKNGQENGKQTTEDQQTSRGYGANSAIGSQKGVGFVDLTKMLFHGDDFQELMVSNRPVPTLYSHNAGPQYPWLSRPLPMVHTPPEMVSLYSGAPRYHLYLDCRRQCGQPQSFTLAGCTYHPLHYVNPSHFPLHHTTAIMRVKGTI